MKPNLNTFIMKTKFVLLLLLILLLQVNIPSFAREMKNARQIELSARTRVQHRSIPVFPIAIVDNTIVSIDLPAVAPTVTIIIKDAETGEVVYSSTDCDVNKLVINLAGEKEGKYTLEIELPEYDFIGDFELLN